MPANLSDEIKLKNIGFSSSDYVFAFSDDEKNLKKNYHKIHGILLDIRLLMSHHSKNSKLIQELEKVFPR